MVKFALLLTVIAIIVAGLIQLDGVFEASTSLRCTYCETISVTSVIDGETFVTGGTTVRLYGVSTPEEGHLVPTSLPSVSKTSQVMP